MRVGRKAGKKRVGIVWGGRDKKRREEGKGREMIGKGEQFFQNVHHHFMPVTLVFSISYR